MSIVKRVRQAVSMQRGQSPETERGPTRLYRCDSCEVTYISGEMDTCARCDAPVETTPTETELGL